MSARKDDTGKPPLSLIPRSALLAEARVMAKGKAKYGADNWRSGKGMEWRRIIDACLRHILAFAAGEDYDNGEGGSGELHLANARCDLAFLIEYYEKGLGKDDRFKPETIASTPDLKNGITSTTVYQVVVRGTRLKDKKTLGTYPTRELADKMANTFFVNHWPADSFALTVEEVSVESA